MFSALVELIRRKTDFEQAKEKADQGDVQAQWSLGRMYEDGRYGAEQDYNAAFVWYCQAANRGHAEAQWDLGRMYEKGLGVAQSNVEACAWYQKAADQGDAYAQWRLGLMYQGGRGVAKSDVEACTWYQKAADQGDADAQNSLGGMYQGGLGVAKNADLALHWYKKAANRGHAEAQFILGEMYANGLGAAKSDEEACAWYQKAASQGYSKAQHALGVMYYYGRGVIRNKEVAFNWFLKASQQGHARAQYNLGLMYEKGDGVRQSDVEACAWYQKAADQGRAAAQYNLDRMYENGRGVAKSDSDARAYKAADEGNAEAQYDLGEMYENGRGVAKNTVLALNWYKKAALQNHTDARARLESQLLVNAATLTVGGRIGGGGFGDVYKGRHEGKTVAIKRLKGTDEMNDGLLKEFKHELILMAALEHPGLVTVYGHTKIPLQLIMEFCQKGSLDTFLQSVSRVDLPWDIRHKMASQLAEGLAYLHEHQVVHRDIKSLNVLVDGRMNVKWADFGLSKIKDHTKTALGQTDVSKRPAGSILWMAPEQVKGKVQCSTKADIYSFAVVMWELTTHKIPYSEMSHLFQIMTAIAENQTNPIPDDTPAHFGTAIRHCWFANPDDRPNAKQLARYLADKNSEERVLMSP